MAPPPLPMMMMMMIVIIMSSSSNDDLFKMIREVRSDASDHRFRAGDSVPLYSNKVGPFHNPRYSPYSSFQLYQFIAPFFKKNYNYLISLCDDQTLFDQSFPKRNYFGSVTSDGEGRLLLHYNICMNVPCFYFIYV